MKQPWRAVSIGGGGLYHDSTFAGDDITGMNTSMGGSMDADPEGNPNRMLWKEMCVAVAKTVVKWPLQPFVHLRGCPCRVRMSTRGRFMVFWAVVRRKPYPSAQLGRSTCGLTTRHSWKRQLTSTFNAFFRRPLEVGCHVGSGDRMDHWQHTQIPW